VLVQHRGDAGGEACTSWTLSWPDKQSDAYLKLLTESSADWVTVDLYYGYFAFRTFATVAEYRSPVFVALKKS